jgi:hypothetical protein
VAVVGIMTLGLGPWSEALAQPTFELGFKAGLSLSKLSGSDLEESNSGTFDLGDGFTGVGTVSSGIGDMKPGFIGGGYAMVHINDRLGVRLEALYSMKGGQGNNSGLFDVYDPTNVFVGTVNLSGTNHLSINYFEVPLLGVATFPTGTASAFELFAGPSFAFKTSAKLKEEITFSTLGASQTETQTTDVGDSFKSTDVGGVLGAGIVFHRDTHPLFMEARWTMGFTEIDNTGGGADWKNSAIAINLGVGFPMVNTSR